MAGMMQTLRGNAAGYISAKTAQTLMMKFGGVVLLGVLIVQNNWVRGLISPMYAGNVTGRSTFMQKIQGTWAKVLYGVDAAVPIPYIEGEDIYAGFSREIRPVVTYRAFSEYL